MSIKPNDIKELLLLLRARSRLYKNPSTDGEAEYSLEVKIQSVHRELEIQHQEKPNAIQNWAYNYRKKWMVDEFAAGESPKTVLEWAMFLKSKL